MPDPAVPMAPFFGASHLNGRPAPDGAASSTWCRRFDAWASPHNWPLEDSPPYVILALAGLAAGLAVMMGVALARNVPLAIVATMVLASIVAVLAGHRALELLPGFRGHVLAEDMLLALGGAVLALWGTGVPIAAGLDLFVAGGGTLIAIGRLGCLAAGCCHGRPCEWGVRYGPTSAVSDALLGVRLFPIQIIEAVWCAAITVVAVCFVLAGTPAGTATTWWLVAYACARFFIEFGRGDPERRYFGALSEAQWSSIVIVAAAVALDGPTRVEPRVWLVLAGLLVLGLLGWAANREWFTQSTNHLLPLNTPTWRSSLAMLEDAARRSAPAPARLPLASAAVSLEILPAAAATELHCYSLTAPDTSIDGDAMWTFTGWALQRAPEHWLLRASFDQRGAFLLWVLVTDPEGPRGSVDEDADSVVAQRAFAFARAARRAAATGGVMGWSEPAA
jgi:hypothetical protein